MHAYASHATLCFKIPAFFMFWLHIIFMLNMSITVYFNLYFIANAVIQPDQQHYVEGTFLFEYILICFLITENNIRKIHSLRLATKMFTETSCFCRKKVLITYMHKYTSTTKIIVFIVLQVKHVWPTKGV